MSISPDEVNPTDWDRLKWIARLSGTTPAKLISDWLTGQRHTDPRIRFWSQVDASGDCWLWTGTTDPDGYGRFNGFNFQGALAHRVAWQIVRGPIGRMHVLHSCDTPACV
jgi:hypothetical protein